MEQSKFYQIKNVTEHGYTLVGCDGRVITRPIQDVDKSASAFTIQDAKDGDVLAIESVNHYPSPFIAIYKERGLDFFNSHCFISFDGEFNKGTTGHDISLIHPATKEQCDLLFQKMKEAGYEFDFEKKELKKIIDKKQIKKNLQDNSFRRMFEKKPAEWSGEDEMFVHGLIRGLSAKRDIHGHTTFSSDCIDITETINWLKSLKGRVQTKIEWSEEDESNLDLAIYHIRKEPYRESDVEPIVDWLRTLKDRVFPQPKQEWSEEDEEMRAAVLQLITDSEKENGWNCVYCNDKEIYFSDIIGWLQSLKSQKQ